MTVALIRNIQAYTFPKKKNLATESSENYILKNQDTQRNANKKGNALLTH